MFLIAIFIIFALALLHSIVRPSVCSHDAQRINTLIRQAARWTLASTQDESPLVALLHANYGAGYLWALKDAFSVHDIQTVSGINLSLFEKKITFAQDYATTNVSKICPQFFGDVDPFFLKLAGDL